MKKTIVLIRHAKSSWKDMSLDDFDRPLNKRGKRDAPFMGELIRNTFPDIFPEKILCSPAKRAKKTAQLFLEGFFGDRDAIPINYDEDIYHGGQMAMIEILANLNPEVETVFLIGHNPGMHLLLEQISDMELMNFPTAAVSIVKMQIDDWTNVRYSKGNVMAYEYPRKYFPKDRINL